MSPLFYLSQVEVLVANNAPPARILAALANLRTQIEAQERELDVLRGLPAKAAEATPEENTAAIPVILSPEMTLPNGPPADPGTGA